MNTKAIKTIGLLSGLGLAIVLYSNVIRNQKDKLAKELLREITKRIRPSTVGLLSEVAFDVDYLEDLLQRTSGSVITLKQGAAVNYAREIYKAWSWFGDDENKVFSVFRNLKDKVQVSQVAKAYQLTYKENLIDKLHDKLNEGEIQKILSIVRILPPYRTMN